MYTHTHVLYCTYNLLAEFEITQNVLQTVPSDDSSESERKQSVEESHLCVLPISLSSGLQP